MTTRSPFLYVASSKLAGVFGTDMATKGQERGGRRFGREAFWGGRRVGGSGTRLIHPNPGQIHLPNTHAQLKTTSITPRKPSARGLSGLCPQAGLSPQRQDGHSLKKKLAKRRISWIKVDRCPMLHHTMRDIEPCVGGCTPSSPNGRGGDCAVARDAMNGLGRDGFSLLFAHFGAKKPIKNLYGGLLKKCLLDPA